MMKKAIGGIAMAAAAALALAACGGSSSNNNKGGGGNSNNTPTKPNKVLTAYNPQPADNLKQGGSMTLPISEIPTQLNGFQGNADLYTSEVGWFYTPNLSYNDPQGNVSFNPD